MKINKITFKNNQAWLVVTSDDGFNEGCAYMKKKIDKLAGDDLI